MFEYFSNQAFVWWHLRIDREDFHRQLTTNNDQSMSDK